MLKAFMIAMGQNGSELYEKNISERIQAAVANRIEELEIKVMQPMIKENEERLNMFVKRVEEMTLALREAIDDKKQLADVNEFLTNLLMKHKSLIVDVKKEQTLLKSKYEVIENQLEAMKESYNGPSSDVYEFQTQSTSV